MNRQLIAKQLSSADILSDEQLKTIATLIYETDPYIYPALFGYGEDGIYNAQTILGRLLKQGNDKMFALDNIFAVFNGGDIAGIILWNKGDLQWNADVLLEAAKQIKVVLDKESVAKVRNGYFFNYDKDSNAFISIINVCIKSEFRGRGYGSFLMRRFIDEHKNEPMELCVLSNNRSAIKMYESCGFNISKQDIGFSVNDNPPLVFYMNKNGK